MNGTVAKTQDAVRFKAISKSFGTVDALKEVSFTVPMNTIFGVLGPNGAGKTTLFSILAGFLQPDKGSIEMLGHRNVADVKGRVGILPQDAMFQSNIPILYQLTFFLRLMGWNREDAEQEVLRVLRLVDLDSVMLHEAATLSHGMYKRLSLAQAFLSSPDLVILDEPTAGLDWKSAKKIRETIKELRENSTILVSSHDMVEMQELCGHVAVLKEGKLQAVGPVDEVTGSAVTISMTLDRQLTPDEEEGCRQTQGLFGLENIEDSNYRLSFEVQLDSEELTGAVKEIQKRLIDLGIVIRSLKEENRLEELYIKLTDQNNETERGK